jgi:hypothetical protein
MVRPGAWLSNTASNTASGRLVCAGLPAWRYSTSSYDGPRVKMRAPHSRANNRRTCTACHVLRPVGVGMLRSFSAVAMPFNVVMPLARISAIVGANAAARASAFAA